MSVVRFKNIVVGALVLSLGLGSVAKADTS